MLGICFLITGCMFGELREEIQEERISYRLYGRVKNTAQDGGHVYVILYVQKDDGLELDRYLLPDDTDTYGFMIKPGTYFVAAFQDTNDNRRHDPGEPAGAYGPPDPIVVPKGTGIDSGKKVLSDCDVKLTPGRFPLGNVETSIENNVNLAESLVKLGQQASWDDPAFSQENADTGFWKPMTFLRQHGVGIYFMAPYDPEKISILFTQAPDTPLSDFQLPWRLQPFYGQ